MLKFYCNLQHVTVSLENVLSAILTAHPMSGMQTAKSSKLMHAPPEPLQIAVAALVGGDLVDSPDWAYSQG